MDTLELLAALGVGPRRYVVRQRYVFTTEASDSWAERLTGNGGAELTSAVGRVIDVFEEVDKTFGLLTFLLCCPGRIRPAGAVLCSRIAPMFGLSALGAIVAVVTGDDTPTGQAPWLQCACESCSVPLGPSPALDYVRGKVPLYTVAEAARLLDVKPSTFETWVNGYERLFPDRKPVYGAPIVSRVAGPRHGPSIPFVGLAEGYFLAALRRSRVPLPRIRQAVEFLEVEIGLEHALANRQVFVVGANLVYDYAQSNGVPELMDLVEIDVHKGQQVFVPVVRDYLEGVALDADGWAERLTLKTRYKIANVQVAPGHSSGQPFFASTGVPVEDVVSRALAGDSIELLASDYRLGVDEIAEAVQIAGPRAA